MWPVHTDIMETQQNQNASNNNTIRSVMKACKQSVF